MKKVALLFISIIILSFILISYMVNNNNKYINNIKKDIINNTDIELINYINEYGNYYIVTDNEYLYLINNKYDIIVDIDFSIIHKNDKNYEIIYKDEKLIYFNDTYKSGKLIYEYYDLYTYELIDKIIVGDNNGK